MEQLAVDAQEVSWALTNLGAEVARLAVTVRAMREQPNTVDGGLS